MARRRKSVLDVREMVRRFRMGQSNREIAHDLGTNRRTIAKYLKLAIQEGWVGAPQMPTAVQIDARMTVVAPNAIYGPQSTVEPYRDRVIELRQKEVEVTAIWQILRDKYGYPGGYGSVLRFVQRIEKRTPEAYVRVEKPPGEELQVDFGYAGKFIDPASGLARRTWIFVATLAYSRHQYAELVFDQKVETWIALHVRTFEWFGGVVGRVVIDNLKSAITKACFHDPQIQRSYRELAEHYDFTIAPCRIETPEHKGKVESGVRYAKRNALAGRDFASIEAGNAHLKRWILTTAGLRDHGTLHQKPLERFEAEKLSLKPLPPTRYEVAAWKQVKLHPDCHVVFEQAYYSAPHRLVGQKLLLRATPERVEIYHGHERVATHARAKHPGQRVSNFVHYPPTKLEGFLVTPVRLREQAAQVGPKTAELIGKLLDEKPVDRLRAAQGILSLVNRYGPARVEAACRRALVFNLVSYRSVKTILIKHMENEPLPPEAVAEGPVPETALYARPLFEIASGL